MSKKCIENGEGEDRTIPKRKIGKEKGERDRIAVELRRARRQFVARNGNIDCFRGITRNSFQLSLANDGF